MSNRDGKKCIPKHQQANYSHATLRSGKYEQHVACGVTTCTCFTLEGKKYGGKMKDAMTTLTEIVEVWNQIFIHDLTIFSGSDTSGRSFFLLPIMPRVNQAVCSALIIV